MIFDSHAHYDDEAFNEDREAILNSLPKNGISPIVNVSARLSGVTATVELTEKYPFIYGSVGVHPDHVGELSEEKIQWMKELTGREKIVAVGEIGLDYYWEENPPRELQKTVFRKQLALAEELRLPVIIHDREAHGDTMDIIREFPAVTGVFHCFSGSPEMAAELLKRGWYIGFDGPVTYKNARRAPEVAAITPPERMLVETDSPYMAPVPVRGKRNDSRNLSYVLETLAAWKGMTPEALTAITWENGRRLFRIP